MFLLSTKNPIKYQGLKIMMSSIAQYKMGQNIQFQAGKEAVARNG